MEREDRLLIGIEFVQTGEEKVRASIERLSEIAKRFKDIAEYHFGEAGKAVGKVYDSAKKAVKGVEDFSVHMMKVGKESGKSAKSLQDFLYRLRSIVLYRMIRGLLTQITKAIKEGMQNLYQYSKAVGTDFAPSMDKLATSALYLKNAFATLFAPFATQFSAWIDVLVDKIVQVINLFARFNALLAGKATYSKALKYQKEYNNSLASGSKKAKDFITSIDELNVLNDNAGSGGASADNYGQMFTEEETGTWKDFLTNSGFIDTITRIIEILGIATMAFKLLKSEGIEGLLLGLRDFADKALAFVLIIEGIKYVVLGIIDILENGVSGEGLGDIFLGIGGILAGLAIAFSSSFAMIAGVIAVAIGAVLKYGDTWGFMVEGIQNVLNGFKDFFGGIFTLDIQRIASGIASIFGGLGEIIFAIGAGAVNTIIKGLNWLSDRLNDFQDFIGLHFYHFGRLALWVTDSPVLKGVGNSAKGVLGFASGGFPEQGQLFIAREAGAEMVGNINGRTAVANNDQIVQAVSNGVFNAMSEALSGQGDRPIMVYLDGQKIYDNQKKIAQSKGYSLGMGVFG